MLPVYRGDQGPHPVGHPRHSHGRSTPDHRRVGSAVGRSHRSVGCSGIYCLSQRLERRSGDKKGLFAGTACGALGADLVFRPPWRSLSEPVPFDLQRVVDILKQRKQAALTLFYQPQQVIGVLVQDGRCVGARAHLSDEQGRL